MSGRFWPIPAARLNVYSEAGIDPFRTLTFYAARQLLVKDRPPAS